MRLTKSILFAVVLLLSAGVGAARADMLYCLEGPGIGAIDSLEQIGSTASTPSADPYGGSVLVTATVGSYNSSTQFTAAADSLSLATINSRDGGTITYNDPNPQTFSPDYSLSVWDIFFVPTEDVTFTIDAQYLASNPYASLEVGLNDLSESGASLYAFADADFPSSGSQDFDLSSDSSDNVVYTGSLTGTLVAGDEYEFYGGTAVEAVATLNDGSYIPFDTGATGSGTISIDFAPIPTGPTAVPLPATLATGAALLGLLAVCRRYRALA